MRVACGWGVCGRGWWVCGEWGWEHLRLACAGGGGMELVCEGRWGLVTHKLRALTPQFFTAFDGQKIA